MQKLLREGQITKQSLLAEARGDEEGDGEARAAVASPASKAAPKAKTKPTSAGLPKDQQRELKSVMDELGSLRSELRNLSRS